MDYHVLIEPHMRNRRPHVWAIYRGDQVDLPDSRPVRRFKGISEALESARKMARNSGGDVVIHMWKHRYREDIYGNFAHWEHSDLPETEPT